MATVTWVGRAGKVAQVTTATPGGTIGTETFTLTIGDRDVSYTAEGGDAVADVVDGLLAAWNASEDAEFGEITATDSTTTLTLTSGEAGKPFTVSGSATGSATLTVATPTANVSPNDANNADNYDTGSVPTNSDVLVFEDNAVDVLWNLDALSSVTGLTVHRKRTYTGTIGLPDTNVGGYPEYRDTYFQISGGTIYDEQGESPSAGQSRWDTGSAQTTLRVIGEGNASDSPGEEATEWKGTHASNAADVDGGSLAVAPKVGDAATLTTLNATDGYVRVGQGVTLATLNVSGGSAQVNSNVTTLNVREGGAVEAFATTAATNVYVYTGSVVWRSSGSFGTADIYEGGVFTVRSPGAVAATAVICRGGEFDDRYAKVTRSYTIDVYGSLEDNIINLGSGSAELTVDNI